ncbi:hypothetical protein VTK56DRAFT_1633 [Thermocarpiscus australiensis]
MPLETTSRGNNADPLFWEHILASLHRRFTPVGTTVVAMQLQAGTALSSCCATREASPNSTLTYGYTTTGHPFVWLGCKYIPKYNHITVVGYKVGRADSEPPPLSVKHPKGHSRLQLTIWNVSPVIRRGHALHVQHDN